MISDHGHEAPRALEKSQRQHIYSRDKQDSRHWSKIVGDNFLKRGVVSNFLRNSSATVSVRIIVLPLVHIALALG